MADENLKELRAKFWKALRLKFHKSRSFLQPGDQTKSGWMQFKVGNMKESKNVGQNIRIDWLDDCQSYQIQVVYFGHPKLPDTKYDPAFSRLWLDFMCERQNEIHNALGYELDWDNHCRIEKYLNAKPVVADIRNLDAWPGYITDMRIQAEHLHAVFQPHALAFNEAHLNG